MARQFSILVYNDTMVGLELCYFEVNGRSYSSAETNPRTALLGLFWLAWLGIGDGGGHLTALVNGGVLSFFDLLRFSLWGRVSGTLPYHRTQNVVHETWGVGSYGVYIMLSTAWLEVKNWCRMDTSVADMPHH